MVPILKVQLYNQPMMNKNLPTHEDEEAEINQILRETFTGCDYYDEEIGHLLHSSEPELKHYLSSNQHKNKNHQSKQSSEASDYSPVYHEEFRSITDDEHQYSFHDSLNQSVEQPIPIAPQLDEFKDMNNRLASFTQKFTTEEVKQMYPNFIVSQPSYQVSKSFLQTISKYSSTLKNINIQAVNISYCKSQDVYIIAMGSDDGRVAIFEERSNKPITFYEVFQGSKKIMTLKWSENQRYLIVTSDSRQLKAFDFKQPIQIEDKTILRLRKKPIELFYLTQKQLTRSIISICEISQSPFLFLLLDEQSEIYLLQWKKHIFNFRPYKTPALPIKFINAFQIKTINIVVNEVQITLIAVGSDNYVTLAMLRPEFELILVYDKDKHGSGMKKQGYPFIDFRKQPLGILIVWGKYAQVINIEIEYVNRLNYRVNGGGYMLFPENSISCGFVTNTLIYQLSHSGIKIYATHHLIENKKVQEVPPQPIYTFMIKYFELPSGLQIQDEIVNVPVKLSILRMLTELISPVKQQLFIVFNTSILRIKIQDFQQYIHNTIQSLNNWKVGLQLLYDSYRGYIKNYDRITKDIIIKNVKQYTMRYIGFLKGVIGGDGQIDFERQKALWDQQIVFIFNLLIQTHQYNYLQQKILSKLVVEGLGPLIANLEPFVMLNRMPVINREGIEHMFEFFKNKNKLLGRIFCHIDIEENEVDLPHLINGLLVNNQFYLELIIINNQFSDFYTPFAVLASQYEKLKIQNEHLDLSVLNSQSLQSLNKLTQFISFSILRTFKILNHNEKYPPFPSLTLHKKQTILDNLLPLFQSTLIPILLSHNQKIFYRHIIPQLYSQTCLQLLNTISNKRFHMNTDLMTNIITNIPQSIISDLTEYWICIIKLFNKRVVRISVFMGLRHLTRVRIEESFIEETVDKSEKELIKQFGQLSNETLSEYFTEIDETNYICLIKLIGTLIQEYIKVIHTLISSNSCRNEKLYEYVEEHLPGMVPAEKEKLKFILMENLEMFVEIDPKRITGIIFHNYFQHISAFQRIQINNHASLKFTKSLIEKLQHQGNFDSYGNNDFLTSLRLQYLKLLALTDRQNQILPQLKKQNYPLDESLQICEYFKVLDAQAYLLVKSGGEGDILTAIKLYFKLLLQKSSQISLQNIQHYKHHFTHIVIECIEICAKMNTQSVDEWFLLVDELKYFKSLLQTTISPFLHDLLAEAIDREIYPIVMKDLVLNTGLTAVWKYVEVSISELELTAFRALIAEVQKNYAYEKIMLKLCQQCYIDDELEKRGNIVGKVLQGFRSNAMCDSCKERDMSLGILIRYSCGHEIHPHCGRDMKVCVLCSEKDENILDKNLDILNRVKAQVYSVVREEEQMEKKSRRSKLSRMAEYEQYFKVNDMLM